MRIGPPLAGFQPRTRSPGSSLKQRPHPKPEIVRGNIGIEIILKILLLEGAKTWLPIEKSVGGLQINVSMREVAHSGFQPETRENAALAFKCPDEITGKAIAAFI